MSGSTSIRGRLGSEVVAELHLRLPMANDCVVSAMETKGTQASRCCDSGMIASKKPVQYPRVVLLRSILLRMPLKLLCR